MDGSLLEGEREKRYRSTAGEEGVIKDTSLIKVVIDEDVTARGLVS